MTVASATIESADPLDAPGVAADTEHLLRLRHLVRNVPERRLAPTGMPGGFVSKRRGRGLETVDIRVFSEGDDIRHIDRNATARSGEPHVRSFRDERERTALLVADFRPSMLWGTRRALRSVAAAEALALTGWRAIEAGGRVGLIAFVAGEPVFVNARARERGMVAVIGAMAAAHRAALEAAAGGREQQEPPLERVIELAAGLAPSDGSVFLATGLDRPGDGFDVVAPALAQRTALTVLLVSDAFERRAPPGDYPFIDGDGRTGWARVGGGRLPVQSDPRLERLAGLGLSTIQIDADVDPETMILNLESYDGWPR